MADASRSQCSLATNSPRNRGNSTVHLTACRYVRHGPRASAGWDPERRYPGRLYTSPSVQRVRLALRGAGRRDRSDSTPGEPCTSPPAVWRRWKNGTGEPRTNPLAEPGSYKAIWICTQLPGLRSGFFQRFISSHWEGAVQRGHDPTAMQRAALQTLRPGSPRGCVVASKNRILWEARGKRPT